MTTRDAGNPWSSLWPPEPPPDDGETLMDLLHRELGAYLISG